MEQLRWEGEQQVQRPQGLAPGLPLRRVGLREVRAGVQQVERRRREGLPELRRRRVGAR
jgi:hypothetical protein